MAEELGICTGKIAGPGMYNIHVKQDFRDEVKIRPNYFVIKTR